MASDAGKRIGFLDILYGLHSEDFPVILSVALATLSSEWRSTTIWRPNQVWCIAGSGMSSWINVQHFRCGRVGASRRRSFFFKHVNVVRETGSKCLPARITTGFAIAMVSNAALTSLALYPSLQAATDVQDETKAAYDLSVKPAVDPSAFVLTMPKSLPSPATSSIMSGYFRKARNRLSSTTAVVPSLRPSWTRMQSRVYVFSDIEFPGLCPGPMGMRLKPTSMPFGITAICPHQTRTSYYVLSDYFAYRYGPVTLAAEKLQKPSLKHLYMLPLDVPLAAIFSAIHIGILAGRGSSRFRKCPQVLR